MAAMTKAQAGRLGGLATVKRYGKDHMQAIGRRGAKTFWRRYTLTPVSIAAFAIIRRDTGQAVALTNYYPRPRPDALAAQEGS